MEAADSSPGKEGTPVINKISFNQSSDCFTITSNYGFSIYQCQPFKLIAHRCMFSF